MKKWITRMFAAALVFSAVSCAGAASEESSKVLASEQETEAESGSETADSAALTENEEELIALLADDIQEITDEDYAELVPEIQYHLDRFSGQVYQIEGVYTEEYAEETPYIYRTLVNGEEETICGLPLYYVDKEIPEGSWIRVTGIVNVHEAGEEMVNALEVMAIQTLEEEGEAVLEWNGSAHAD